MLIEIYFETKFYVEIFYQGDGYPIIHDLNLDCYFVFAPFYFYTCSCLHDHKHF